MIVKWIVCQVSDPVAFDRGQRGWTDLAALPGFLGQIGGWSTTVPGQAHVLGFWNDRRDHDAFMAGAHDRLASDQQGSYSGIEARLFASALEIGTLRLTDLARTEVVRLAHCLVRPDRREHFVTVQGDVWIPAMAAAEGMLGGTFGERDRERDEFLVLSLWESADAHDAYGTGSVRRLRETAGVADDVDRLVGALIELEPAWTVLP